MKNTHVCGLPRCRLVAVQDVCVCVCVSMCVCVCASVRVCVCACSCKKKEHKDSLIGSGDRPGGRKVCALPQKFVFLGFRREESGMSRDFCRDVPDPWRCSKSLRKKSLWAFFVPYLCACLCVCGTENPHIERKETQGWALREQHKQNCWANKCSWGGEAPSDTEFFLRKLIRNNSLCKKEHELHALFLEKGSLFPIDVVGAKCIKILQKTTLRKLCL